MIKKVQCIVHCSLGNRKPKSSKENETNVSTSSANIEEPLDLADLDLSRLRLSKKDLETLSSITPGLPKCFQEQLLAKLPPTQARKLSRTLSMQNSIHVPIVRIYKRSQSGGRNMTTTETDRFAQVEDTIELEKKIIDSKSAVTKLIDSSREESSDRSHSLIYRRSLSSSRYDNGSPPDVKTRSASVCRVSDDYSKSLCSSYSSDVSDKYKYYSPYLMKGRESDNGYVSPYRRYDSISPRESSFSPTKEFKNRTLGGSISPTSDGLGNIQSQRRYSRFIRQDSGGGNIDENREKKLRDRESQSILREIKEKSRESSRDRLSQSMELDPSLVESDAKSKVNMARHVRNKSLEVYCDVNELRKDVSKHTRHISRTRDLPEGSVHKEEVASKILDELQMLSSAKTRREKSEETSSNASREITSDKVVVKKIRKLKPKEKHLDSATTDTGIAVETKANVVKKVKKIIKRVDPTGEEKTRNLQQESSTSKSDLEKPKRESKLKRPKSFPTKEAENPSTAANSNVFESSTNELKSSQVKTVNETSPENCTEAKDIRLVRPKSYPASKLTPPKDIKRILSTPSEKTSTEVTVKQIPKRSNLSEEKSSSTVTTTAKSSDSSSPTESKPPTVKRIVKVSRKSKITSPTPTHKSAIDSKSKEKSPSEAQSLKEKSPDKKIGKGLLYAIGQKFEKLRDSTKNKEKKIVPKATNSANSLGQNMLEEQKEKPTLLKKKKAKSTPECFQVEKNGEKTEEKLPKSENRRSRIDAMIRSLRERSVPRTPVLTESTLLKRAVSVEEMPGTFNKCAVNRVLGLFKRFEKDSGDRKVRSTRSTSNIERQMQKSESPIHQKRDRPKSSGFLSKINKNANVMLISKPEENNEFQPPVQVLTKKNETSNSTEILAAPPVNAMNICPDCIQDQVPDKNVPATVIIEETVEQPRTSNNINKDYIKDKRKALVLDFTKLDKIDNKLASVMRQNPSLNGNTVANAPNHDNASNNNNVKASSTEINRNHIFPTPNDNATNYSSDSRSFHDDCASTSTFLSPTDEPELCFDNWSVCSEDNYILATPSPTVSRLSRTSHYSSPTHPSDGNESVIDRIKRRSFYSRFNEKRPKRQSTIVGPGARDYYRETASAANKVKSTTERQPSPDITKEFFKPLKLSPAGSELKPPVYRSITDSSKPRRLDNLLSSTSPSCLSKRYTPMDNDYMLCASRTKSTSTYDHNGSTQPTSYYNTYNPNRRSSYNLNGSITGSNLPSHTIDGYATVGRRSTLRPYDHRTMSLLDPLGQSSTSMVGTYKRDYRIPIGDVRTLPRSRPNYRSTSVTRSPTNI